MARSAGAPGDRLDLTREQVLRHRRLVGALEERLPGGADSLRRAARAGLQDSMPRAALLSIHARVKGTHAAALDDPSLVQLWGPRFSAYVVAEADRAIFTVGRLIGDPRSEQRATQLADQLEAFLDGRRMGYGEAGHAMGIPPNRLRYAAPSGRVVMRWDSARRPTIWMLPRPMIDPGEAGLELARRYLHVFGPTTPTAFARWAGISARQGEAAFDGLATTLTPVRTPVGEGWILASDEAAYVASGRPPAAARLLPSGDAYYLLQGRDRELLVPDSGRRDLLWTSRVWPGAVLVDGDVVATWRRDGPAITIEPWRRLASSERSAVEAEAIAVPLPGLGGAIRVAWAR
jgi:DNA glycosylase AlkZ-like